jgi:hypothetical protein
MQERNDAWMRDYGLQGCGYDWSLDDAQLTFRPGCDEVVADVCVIGSVSEVEGTFLWAWANEAIPHQARRGLERVREFGASNALELLTKSEWLGGRSDGLEMAAVAGRVLDASGVWVAPTGDVTLFLALSNFGRFQPGLEIEEGAAPALPCRVQRLDIKMNEQIVGREGKRDQRQVWRRAA